MKSIGGSAPASDPNREARRSRGPGRPSDSYRPGYWKRVSKYEARQGFAHVLDRDTARSVLRSRMRERQGRWNGKGDPKIVVSLKKQGY